MNSSLARRPLSIWVAGDPVPSAARRAGSFARMIRTKTGAAWPGEWIELDVTDEHAALPDPEEIAGVIVTGSPARVADQHAWMRRVQTALRELVELNVPVLGICFGHQLLGMALGGRSGPNSRGREIGTVDLQVLHADPMLGPPACYPVSMTHLDVVHELPPAAERLAETELDPNAAIRFGEHAWGVQFHPEMDGAVLSDYIDTLQDALISEGIDPASVRATCADTPIAENVLRAFAARAAALQ